MRTFFLGCVLFLACVLVMPANAGAIYSYSYSTDASSYTGAAGSVVPVNIYLDEALSGTSTSYINSNGGVSGAGAAVNVVSTSGGTAASFGSGNAVFTASPNFGTPPSSSGGTLYYNQGSGAQANNLEFAETISTTQSGVPQASGSVLLGTLDVTVGTGTTTYVASSLYSDTINGGNSVLGQSYGYTGTSGPSPFGTDLDKSEATPAGAAGTAGTIDGGGAASSFTFTVGPAASPVPEPASLAVFGLGGAALLMHRRRQTA